MSRTFTLDSIHKTYISQISLFTFKKNAQPQVKKALSGVSITLTPGLYGLLGPNGAGKSTLIHIITGTLAPDSGEVLWRGKPAMGIAFRRILGYMPQQQGLYDSYTGRRFLAYMAALKENSSKSCCSRGRSRSSRRKFDRRVGQAPFCLFRRYEAAPAVGIRSAWRSEAVDFRRTNGRP